MEHFSTRLNRNFQDDDQLLFTEALSVISQNSEGLTVPTRHLSDLANVGELHPIEVSPRHLYLYLYSEVKGLTYKKGPGRKKHVQPNANAERQRKFRSAHPQLKKVS